jgi:hypothetical protein
MTNGLSKEKLLLNKPKLLERLLKADKSQPKRSQNPLNPQLQPKLLNPTPKRPNNQKQLQLLPKRQNNQKPQQLPLKNQINQKLNKKLLLQQKLPQK